MSLFEPYEPKAHGSPLEEIELDRALPADLGALVSITVQRESLDPGDVESRLSREIGMDDSRHLLMVARHRGECVAFGRVSYVDRPAGARADHVPAGFYLGGVIVDPDFRRRGIGARLTEARISWVAERAGELFYIAGEINLASIDLHEGFGFEELTRTFFAPRVSFQSGGGILFRLDLRPGSLRPE